MIVEYIGDTYKVSLQKGKRYEATEITRGIYAIKDETGEVYGFPVQGFRVIYASQSIPTIGIMTSRDRQDSAPKIEKDTL